MRVRVLEYQRMSDRSERFHYGRDMGIAIGCEKFADGGLGDIQSLGEFGLGYSSLSHGDIQGELGGGHWFEGDEILPRRDRAGRRDVPSGDYVSGKRDGESVLRHIKRFGPCLAAGERAANVGKCYIVAAAFFRI